MSSLIGSAILQDQAFALPPFKQSLINELLPHLTRINDLPELARVVTSIEMRGGCELESLDVFLWVTSLEIGTFEPLH